MSWNLPLLVLAVFLALGAAAAGTRVPEREPEQVALHARAAGLAAAMASYRGAVAAWFDAHPAAAGSAPYQALLDEGLLPGWATLDAGQWGNYRDADGVIFVFPARALPVDIDAALLALSDNSPLVGRLQAGGAGQRQFVSLLGGMPGVPVPAAAPLPAASGAPLWLATHN